MNDFTFTKEAFEEYLYWQMQDKKTLKRINALMKDIRTNGALNGTGKPEKLKYQEGYSRRIDDANRLVYEIDELQNIKIVSCRGHYED
ncbi:Txe/YoeB family addiction module toxin [Anaerosporobacter sp.]|uniref:Txe/YoeB family addiction module toxin n=1 Tax=Anaerosporobacter sp. TaxID=1872529 RepID=UPI00286F5F75|nr:Txe/YoeB family addiction module toxin [Anaerosporobacter sp.]